MSKKQQIESLAAWHEKTILDVSARIWEFAEARHEGVQIGLTVMPRCCGTTALTLKQGFRVFRPR